MWCEKLRQAAFDELSRSGEFVVAVMMKSFALFRNCRLDAVRRAGHED